MLTDFQNSFTSDLPLKFLASRAKMSHHTLNALLDYLVKCQVLMLEKKQQQPETCIVICGILNDNIGTRFRCGVTCDH